MKKKTDYIPSGDEEFNEWQANFMVVIVTIATALSIPASEVANLTTLKNAWNTAWAVGGKGHKTTRTPQQTKAKTTARTNYEKALRNFVKRWVTNNQGTAADQKVALRVNVADGIRTSKTTPSTKPVCSGKESTEHMMASIDVRDEDSPLSRKRPDEYKEYEVWGIVYMPDTDVPSPIPVSSFSYQKSSTRHNTSFVFAEGSTGGTFAYRLRWKNSKGETGPWSDVYTILIS